VNIFVHYKWEQKKTRQASRPSKTAVPESKSKLKIFTKFAKIFKSKISKICSTVLCKLAHRYCVQKRFVRIGEKL